MIIRKVAGRSQKTRSKKRQKKIESYISTLGTSNDIISFLGENVFTEPNTQQFFMLC